VPDVDPKCGVNPPTAGACITGDYLLTPECRCEGDQWKADPLIEIVAEIHVFRGTYPFKNRSPADTTVKDADSAVEHEYGHLSDAVNALIPHFRAVEAKTYTCEADCLAAIFDAATKARPVWDAALKRSQHTRQ